MFISFLSSSFIFFFFFFAEILVLQSKLHVGRILNFGRYLPRVSWLKEWGEGFLFERMIQFQSPKRHGIGKKKNREESPKRCYLRLETKDPCETPKSVTVHKTGLSNHGPYSSLLFFAWNDSSCLANRKNGRFKVFPVGSSGSVQVSEPWHMPLRFRKFHIYY